MNHLIDRLKDRLHAVKKRICKLKAKHNEVHWNIAKIDKKINLRGRLKSKVQNEELSYMLNLLPE